MKKKILSLALALIIVISVLSVPAFAAMQIHVKTEAEEIITLEVELTDTIGAVKEKIQSKKGIAPADQILIFNEQELENEFTLGDYNIEKDGVLHLQVRSPLGDAKEEALQQLTAAAKGDDCCEMKAILAKAAEAIDSCESEGEIDLAVAMTLKEIAKHLPRHAGFNVIFGGEGGLIGLLVSFFRQNVLEKLSQFSLITGIVKVITGLFA